MKILNETVYDTSDLKKVLLFARDRANEIQVQAVAQGKARTVVVHTLPDQIRFGYFNRKVEADGTRSTAAEPGYVNRRGNTYRNDNTIRLGIVRPADLPINAMEVLAREAADLSRRTLPKRVIADLVKMIQRGVLRAMHIWDVEDAVLMEGCPPVHYHHKADAEATRAAKASATAEALSRAEKQVGWDAQMIEELKKRVTEAEEKLVKSQARLAKLKARSQKGEVSYVG